MQLRASILAGLAFAAAILALPGCHKPKGGDSQGNAGPASLRSLLDYNAAQTARIVAAASDRPAKLDRLIVHQGQPYPTFLWSAGLRTSQPFHCVTAVATQVRCYAELSWVGTDRVAGYADVIMYDHDVTVADMLADRDENEPAQAGQTVATTTVAMYQNDPNSPSTTCRQALGPLSNGWTTCVSPAGARTVLWARLEPGAPSYNSDGTQAVSLKPNYVVAALDRMIKQIREAMTDDGSKLFQRPAVGAEMDFSGPGWYAASRGFIFRDSLYAGPFSDESSCQADLTRASTIYSQFVREQRTIDHCEYYESAPEGF